MRERPRAEYFLDGGNPASPAQAPIDDHQVGPFAPALSGDVSKLMIVIRQADCFGTNTVGPEAPGESGPPGHPRGSRVSRDGLASPRMSHAFIGHSSL